MRLQRAAKNNEGEMCDVPQSTGGKKITKESWLQPHSKLKLRRILVPIDFSEPSKKALQYAITVASEFESELILVHVVRPYPIIPEFPAATPEMNSMLTTTAAEELQKLAAAVNGGEVKQIVCMGDPAREIAAEAERQSADMIIINTHGRTGLGHLFIGSVAEHVVRLAKCPVLTVRETGRDFLNIAPDDAELNRIGIRTTSRSKEELCHSI